MMLFGIFNNLLVGLAPCYLVAKTEEIQSLQVTSMKKLLCTRLYMNLSFDGLPLSFDVLTMLCV